MLGKLGRLFQPKDQRPYKLFQVEPSLECNLECVMCPWSELRPDVGLMSWGIFTRIAGYLHLAEGVDFTGGGEPTLNPRLPEMIRAAKEAGCEVGFSTNGTMLDRNLAETLLALGQDWISFSVDGATPETYNSIRQGADLNAVIHNIQGLHDLKAARSSQTPKLMMVFVMMRENYDELPVYIDLAHQLGVEQVIAKNLDVILKDEDDTRRLFSHSAEGQRAVLRPVIAEAQKRANKWGIGLRLYALQPQELAMCEHNPLKSLFFNWAGYVSPCITLSYAENRVFNGEQHFVTCQRFGHIKEETLEEIWHKLEYQAFRRSFEGRVRLERQATISLLVGGQQEDAPDMPPAPEGCRTCYYLYGV